MNIEKRRAEIAARKVEIRNLITADNNADMDALEKELRELNEEDSKLEKRQAEIAREVKKLEKELVDIDELLFGEAATDYKRAAELEERKAEAEEELMMLYEEDEAVSAELEEWNN